jgi:hypothetical protein
MAGNDVVVFSRSRREMIASFLVLLEDFKAPGRGEATTPPKKTKTLETGSRILGDRSGYCLLLSKVNSRGNEIYTIRKK